MYIGEILLVVWDCFILVNSLVNKFGSFFSMRSAITSIFSSLILGDVYKNEIFNVFVKKMIVKFTKIMSSNVI